MSWYDKDEIKKNSDGTYTQTFNRDGNTITWTQDAGGRVLNESVQKGETSGLRTSNTTPSNKTNTYTFNDGTRYTGAETNWQDAARAAGNTSGLRTAISYPNYVDNDEALRYLSEMAGNYGVDIYNPLGGSKTYSPQEALQKGLIPDYNVPFGRPGEGGININGNINPITGTNTAAMTQLLDSILMGGSDRPTYDGRWERERDRLADIALNMRYDDWVKGDQYDALSRRYGDNGQMAMKDVLGQISSRTGGLASSYAASAGQQQYNDYMAKLEQAAMEMFNNERGNAIQNVNLASSLADNDYGRYQDDLSQWNTDRNFNYNAYRDSVADSRYADETAYKRSMDEKELSLADKKDANDRITAYLAAGGRLSDLDDDILAASGLTPAELAAQENYYIMQAQAKAAKGSGKGGGGGSSKGTSSDGMDYEGLFEAASKNRNPEIFIKNNCKEYGFTTGSASDLINEYYFWENGGYDSGSGGSSGGSTSGGRTFLDSARDYADDYKKKDSELSDRISSFLAANMMTKSEWNTRKAASQRNGGGDWEITSYDTYEDYVNDYYKYAEKEAVSYSSYAEFLKSFDKE